MLKLKITARQKRRIFGHGPAATLWCAWFGVDANGADPKRVIPNWSDASWQEVDGLIIDWVNADDDSPHLRVAEIKVNHLDDGSCNFTIRDRANFEYVDFDFIGCDIWEFANKMLQDKAEDGKFRPMEGTKVGEVGYA